MKGLLKQVKKEKIFDDIVKQIRKLIKTGAIKTGDKLPPERDLAQSFRVSRASVREAIRALEAAELVNTRGGDGTYVVAHSVENLTEPFAAAMVGGRESLMDIFAVRKMIEPNIASLVAKRASNYEISQLKKIISLQKKDSNDPNLVTETDSAFHLFLAEIAKSGVFLKVHNTLKELTSQTREEFLQEGDRPRISIEGHEEIVSAIEKRDPSFAKNAMLRHLRNIERESLKTGRKKDDLPKET
ncbi:MAG: FadR/GntR family transcriptional regulator [Pseudomonadota bacterium]